MDVTQFALVVMKNVRDFVQPALDGLCKRIEEREAEIRKDFADAIAKTPAGEKGECGERGEKGLDGINGERGAQGERGEKGLTGERGENGLNGQQGEQGVAGEQGQRGEKGEKGEPGAAGKDGEPGKSLSVADIEPLLDAMRAKWELDWERRAFVFMQGAIDRAPKAVDGRDGKDGIGFENMSFEQIDERNCVMRFTLGEQVKEFPIKLAAFVYRGVWSENDQSYLKGDGVTWRGSLFMAQKDAPEGEPETTPDWQLAVKRGRNGSDTIKLAPPPAQPVRIAR